MAGGVADSGLRYLGQIAGLRVRLASLFDTTRIHETVGTLVSFEKVRANIDRGLVEAVAVATALGGDRRHRRFLAQAGACPWDVIPTPARSVSPPRTPAAGALPHQQEWTQAFATQTSCPLCTNVSRLVVARPGRLWPQPGTRPRSWVLTSRSVG
ncbi:hypothetical protein MLGJGCBP_01261 [Rhodococcus sp. T7]|nr:hypothetical protein MLGJGCBP_01261 [Rhodococcus sp. T7]